MWRERYTGQRRQRREGGGHGSEFILTVLADSLLALSEQTVTGVGGPLALRATGPLTRATGMLLMLRPMRMTEWLM